MIRLVTLLMLLVFALPVSATIQQVTTEFERRLEQTQKKYQRTSEQVQQQRQPQLKQLQKIESQLMALRQQLAGYTRDQDEQFVSIQALQQRLQKWQKQSRYIDNLLQRFLESQSNPNADDFSQKLKGIRRASQPEWQHATVVGLDGRMLSGQQLTVGPLSWFVDEHKQGFIADANSQPATLIMESPVTLSAQAMPVDISQDKAIRLAARHSSWRSTFEQGGVWVYPILMLAVLATWVVIYKLYGLSRLSRLQPRLAEQALAGEQPQIAGWQQQLFDLAQRHCHWPQEALADKLHHQLLQWKAVLDSKMVILTATATVAPLLGLLGTVSGMIQTFEMMNLFGNQDQTMLAGGISEALVTTELGLIVAVPVLLIHAYINRRHQSYLAQLEADAVLYTQPLTGAHHDAASITP